MFIWSRGKERVGRSKLIQTNLAEPDVELSWTLNSKNKRETETFKFVRAISKLNLTKFRSSHEKFDVWSRSYFSLYDNKSEKT